MAQLTIDHLPLFIEPTPRSVVSPLEDNVVALESAREIIPCRCDETVFSLEVSDDLVARSLCSQLVTINEE